MSQASIGKCFALCRLFERRLQRKPSSLPELMVEVVLTVSTPPPTSYTKLLLLILTVSTFSLVRSTKLLMFWRFC
jgi:hypothetical protein